MRLIDADELKNKLSDKDYITYTHEYGDAIPVDWIISAIDNAPTVEPFEPDYVGAERLKARQRGYEEGYHNGMKIGKTLNPKIKQGEWIRKEDVIHSIAKQYSEHNELVPIWLSIGDIKS